MHKTKYIKIPGGAGSDSGGSVLAVQGGEIPNNFLAMFASNIYINTVYLEIPNDYNL